MQSKHKDKYFKNVEDRICPKLEKKSTFVFNFFETLWKWYNVNFGAKLIRKILFMTDKIFSVKFVI